MNLFALVLNFNYSAELRRHFYFPLAWHLVRVTYTGPQHFINIVFTSEGTNRLLAVKSISEDVDIDAARFPRHSWFLDCFAAVLLAANFELHYYPYVSRSYTTITVEQFILQSVNAAVQLKVNGELFALELPPLSGKTVLGQECSATVQLSHSLKAADLNLLLTALLLKIGFESFFLRASQQLFLQSLRKLLHFFSFLSLAPSLSIKGLNTSDFVPVN